MLLKCLILVLIVATATCAVDIKIEKLYDDHELLHRLRLIHLVARTQSVLSKYLRGSSKIQAMTGPGVAITNYMDA